MDFLTTALAAAIGIVIGFTAVIVAVAAAASNKMVSPPRAKGSWTPKDLGHDYEDVEVLTPDGVRLRGWFIDKGSDKTVLAIHGYTSSKWDETYMKPVIDILARNGYNVAAFDLRAHGESGGDRTTLGKREAADMKAVIEWLKREKPGKARKVGAIGYSMGGAVTIMLASEPGLLDAAVADSPYIDIMRSGKRWVRRVKGVLGALLRLAYPLIVRFTSSKAGIRPEELNMMRYADRVRAPMLLIAGERDDLVTVDEVRKFYEAARRTNPNIELWVTDSAHVRTVKDRPREYEERIISFFRKHMG